MKTRPFHVILLIAVFTVLFFLFYMLATTARAQGEPPPPYAGLTNPFPWNDASAQQAGKQMYQTSCLGCHGANGRALPGADFGASDFSRQLEQKPDLYFWILSEGRLSQGMPPFKSPLSEPQRWQVLTYLWALGRAAPPPATTPSTSTVPEIPGANLVLMAPPQARSGQVLTLSATLRDAQGMPIENASVEFFIKVDFFATGLIKVGESTTSNQGVASITYPSRQTGDTQVVARYHNVEAAATVNLAESDAPFYRPEVGIKLPGMGNEDQYIGPRPTPQPGQTVEAPTGGFRLPGGALSWLWPIAGLVAMIWATYFRVFYQVLHIPIVKDITDTDTRLVPRIAMVFMALVGVVLVLMFLHGPYTHLHLLNWPG